MKTNLRLLAPLFVLLPSLLLAVDVTAQSAIVIDGGSGRVLWEKDAHSARFPASTTKVMTALLLIEKTRPEEIVVAPPEIKEVGESSMHLKPGERITARNLLFGIMLRSANDGSYAAAKHLAGSIPAFSKMMNDRAHALGCRDTHFNNPNGLNDPQHYTSAYDLALITREAMKYPEFREVVSTEKRLIERSINKADRTMVNRNKLLKKDPTVEGVKTGWTRPAGHCFVGAATREGFRVITVVFKSDNWQEDTEKLMKSAYLEFEKRDEVKANEPVGQLKIPNAAGPVQVAVTEDTYALARKADGREIKKELVLNEGVVAPVEKGAVIGELVLEDGNGYKQSVPVAALEDVAANTILHRAGSNPSFLFVGSMLCGGAFWMRNRARRRMRTYARKASKPTRT
jgi:D-alanyl-D-alanine carboxypeptidase (penicillin-binding protein 5/6)